MSVSLVHISQKCNIIGTCYFCREKQELKSERERRERKLSAAAIFVKVNDEHQKPQSREKNKQVVNQCCRIKSLGCNERPVSIRVCVEYYSGWLAVTSVAIIETRSAQGRGCNNATHTHSLIILNHALSHLWPPVSFLSSCVHHSLYSFGSHTFFTPKTNF